MLTVVPSWPERAPLERDKCNQIEVNSPTSLLHATRSLTLSLPLSHAVSSSISRCLSFYLMLPLPLSHAQAFSQQSRCHSVHLMLSLSHKKHTDWALCMDLLLTDFIICHRHTLIGQSRQGRSETCSAGVSRESSAV